MKDVKDIQTTDIFASKRPEGRPRKYVDNASRQRAYRERKKRKFDK